ncbi:MAG TPA: GntR family transcriptional regulator, partial [Aldersonia sp.]
MTSTPDGELHETVLTRLGTEIVSGALPVGAVLTLDDIGAEYGVSRSVAREAIRVLES